MTHRNNIDNKLFIKYFINYPIVTYAYSKTISPFKFFTSNRAGISTL